MINKKSVFIEQNVLTKYGRGWIESIYTNIIGKDYARVNLGSKTLSFKLKDLDPLDGDNIVSFRYKNFMGTRQYNSDTDLYFGKVLGYTKDITYESYDLDSLEEEFKKVVKNLKTK